MRKLDESWGDRGLRIVTAYTQYHDLETIEKHVKEIGMKYPVALDGFYETRFDAPILCKIWVMGPDGKVVWTGIQGWEEATMKALLKLKYPGLEMNDVERKVKPAAKTFSKGEFAKAYKLAEEISFGDYSDEAVGQADKIIERIETQLDDLNNLMKVHEISANYVQAIACLNELRRYAGLEDAPDADAEIKRIKALDDYEAQMRSRRAYIEVRAKAWRGFEGIEDTKEATLNAARDAQKLLSEFAKTHKDAAVADHAEQRAAEYKAWGNDLEEEIKKE